MDYESLIYIDRNGTDSVKWDGTKQTFGEAGLLPLWVADMDFQAPACVREAVAAWAAHGAYGYGVIPDRWYKAFQNWEYQRQAIFNRQATGQGRHCAAIARSGFNGI